MGKRNAEENNMPMEFEPGTTAGTLKERLGMDQKDWLFVRATNGMVRLIPDHEPIPEDAAFILVGPRFGE